MGYVLGVDLGTTFTAAAVGESGGVDIFPLSDQAHVIPSVLLLRDDGQVLAGEVAQRRSVTEPGRAAREFKRRLGDPTPLLLGGTPYGADALMGMLLKVVVQQVGQLRGEEPELVCLTHPASYGEYKKDLLRQVAAQGGVVNWVLTTEPQAAAVNHAASERVSPGDVFAVYDLGGGTFDAALVQAEEGGSFRLLGTPEGLERIGGIDFDQAVLAHVDAAVDGQVAELDLTDPVAAGALARLRVECRDAKEALSSDNDVSIPVMLPNLATEVRLRRTEFEAMIRPRVDDTIDALSRAVRSAGLGVEDLAATLLVGGSSRIPLVRERVREVTDRPVSLDAHPKHSIALGAARVALAGGEPTSAAAPAPAPEPVLRPELTGAIPVVAITPPPAPPPPPGFEAPPTVVSAPPGVAPVTPAVRPESPPTVHSAAPVPPPAPAPEAAPAPIPPPPAAPPPAPAPAVAPAAPMVEADTVETLSPAAAAAAPRYVPPAGADGADGADGSGPNRTVMFAVAAAVVVALVVGAFFVLSGGDDGGSDSGDQGDGEVADAGSTETPDADTADQDPDGEAEPVDTGDELLDFPAGSEPFRLVATSSDLWVTNAGSTTVSRLDVNTGEFAEEIDIGGEPAGIDGDDEAIWVSNYSANQVVVIDPSSGEQTPIDVGLGPRNLTLSSTGLWVANLDGDSVTQIDNSTATVLAEIPVGDGPRGIAADETSIWVSNSEEGTVSQIDPSAQAVVNTVEVGGFPGGIAIAGGYVWVTESDSDTIVQIDPASLSIVAQIPAGTDPGGTTTDGTFVYVSNAGDDTILQIDSSTGEVVNTLTSGDGPAGLDATDAGLWVANNLAGTVSRLAVG